MQAIRLAAIAIFPGPSFNNTVTADMQGLGKVGYSVWSKEAYGWSHDLSIGAEGGIQFHLDGLKHKNRQ
jgi:hypothetical protein